MKVLVVGTRQPGHGGHGGHGGHAGHRGDVGPERTRRLPPRMAAPAGPEPPASTIPLSAPGGEGAPTPRR